ncbi:murein L,D-transpeptidase YafK [Flavobacterium sp. 28YEA47A]|uniref:L,D-transpeptidase family protein n=1 Tax=Flavobacterium sp. 28YEA47A TaxID=3156276 RepID=UPI0035116476
MLLLILPISFLLYYFYPEPKLPKGKIIDRIEVYKSKRKMDVYSDGILLKRYRIALGKNPIGHKEFEGDCKTPEGIYTIEGKNPESAFHKNLGVSYPNEKDIEHAMSLGKSAGGDIKIHGLRNGYGYRAKFHRWKDWTAGCIAVTDREIDELYEAVQQGAEIEIFP